VMIQVNIKNLDRF